MIFIHISNSFFAKEFCRKWDLQKTKNNEV